MVFSVENLLVSYYELYILLVLRSFIGRLSLLFRRNFDDEFGVIVVRIERRTRVVDTTATALYQKRLEHHLLGE